MEEYLHILVTEQFRVFADAIPLASCSSYSLANPDIIVNTNKDKNLFGAGPVSVSFQSYLGQMYTVFLS